MKTLLGQSLLPLALVFCAIVALKISGDLQGTAEKAKTDIIAALDQAKKDAPAIAGQSGKEAGKGFVKGAGGEIGKAAVVVAAAPVVAPAVVPVVLLPKKNQEKLKRWVKKTF